MRNSRLRRGLALALLTCWPAGSVLAQADVDAPAGDDAAEAEEPAASESPPAAEPPVDDPPAEQAEAETTELAAAEDADGGEGALEGAITDPTQLTDEDLLEVDPEMLIDPLPRRPRPGIYGRVVDAGTGEPLYAEVPVVLVEGNERQFSTTDGFFVFRVRPGTYTLRSFFERYQNATVPDVRVRPGRTTEVVIRLVPDTAGPDDDLGITITAESGTVARRLEERQQAAAVSDGFTAEEIQQSGDSDADQAVRRVVGITTDQDGFLFVRGLGGRYVQTLVDGSPFPSTDPDNPGVRLTLFPTDVLSGLNVYKTFTADFPASMAGGLLELETRSYPSRFTINAGVSLGLNTETTFGQVPTYQGGSLDWLGYDDGTRAIPDSVADRRLPRPSDPDYLDLAGDFPFDFALESRTALPNLTVSANVGDTILVGERFVGYYLAFRYAYAEQQYTDQQVRSVRVGAGPEICSSPDPDVRATCPNIINDDYVRNTGIVESQLSGLGAFTFELADQQTLHFTTVYTNFAENFASIEEGLNNTDNEDFRTQQFVFTQEQAWWNQLRGDHDDIIGSIDLDWRLGAALARRYQPDVRQVAYRAIDEDPFRFFGRNPNEGQRLYTDLDQIELSGAADVTMPFDADFGEGSVKVGAYLAGFDRDFLFRRFELNAVDLTDPALLLPPGDLFVVERLGSDGSFEMDEGTRSVDSYFATQRNYAAYAHFDSELFVNWLRLIAGVRGEVFRQTLETQTDFVGEGARTDANRRTDVDVLPSVNLVARAYEASASSNVPGTMQVRAGYSQTVARPLIRELAPFVFPDFVRGGTIAGNPDLVRTLVQSFDVRWEWFISATEVLAVSGFIKVFEDPIERVVVGTNNQFGFNNIPEAQNLGLELESRIDFGRFTDVLDGLALGANVTFVRSEVRFDIEDQPLATNFTRPMAGQSPYVVNVSLSWDPESKNIPLELAVFYNVFGERITEVGSQGLQDIYQQPFHALNFTARWATSERVNLKLTLKNLLLSEQEFIQGGFVVYSYAPGMTVKLGLGLTFE